LKASGELILSDKRFAEHLLWASTKDVFFVVDAPNKQRTAQWLSSTQTRAQPSCYASNIKGERPCCITKAESPVLGMGFILVRKHNTPASCWVVLYGDVHDVWIQKE
jgi:cytochrome b involved in lipid metabolism